MNKGVTILVPTFNRPEMLRKSLECLNNRTAYQPKEVIVIDDGSSPDCFPYYDQMEKDKLFDKIIKLPQKGYARLTDGPYLAGLQISNPEFDYVHFGADDLLYRTNWVQVLIDMIESDWAKKYNVQIISGFSHWALPGDIITMKKYINEMYKSTDGKVEGYVAEWGGNWFLKKSYFNQIGGFVNNLKIHQVPEQYAGSYEAIMQYKGFEFGFKWANTLETYVQTMALPGSSTLGNYRRDANGQLVTNERYRDGIAIGILWKDE
jgi:Glycosyl transferase family 2